jgi:hypothetical protein
MAGGGASGDAGASGSGGTSGTSGSAGSGGMSGSGGGGAAGSGGVAGSGGSAGSGGGGTGGGGSGGSLLPDGSVCALAGDCAGGRCQNGHCCATGDCCAADGDCPASYATAPACASQATCQGSKQVARCTGFTCASATVDDDSACTGPAMSCGAYPPVACNGQVAQAPPGCATSCTTATDCAPGAYCGSGVCRPTEANGHTCTAGGDCASSHCQNGHCCANGDCCAADADCAAYGHAAMCASQATCQGTRVDGICTSTFTCIAAAFDDDAGCAGLVSNDCGAYPSVTCTTAASQLTDQSAMCATSCTSDNQCDLAAHCATASGTCVPDGDAGSSCMQQNECRSGLTCVDNVCCTSACAGACVSCALPGSVGTCAPIPAGQDPDAECDAVSCAGYYQGWSGSTCYRKADVTAAQAACDGAGACRTAAQECAAQTTRGAATTTCNAACQTPNAPTCTGTVAGTCANIIPGNQSCGNGVCRVTVPMCINGAPNTCVPNSGAAHAESCNGLDDDCDGPIDDGAFADTSEPNNSCSEYRTLATVGSDQTLTFNNFTLYPSGDVDYYRIPAMETDSSCTCCDLFCTDEDFRLTITLTVPAGAGSYQFCSDTACGTVSNYCVTVPAGGSNYWQWNLDGSCPGIDSYSVYVRVSPGNSPGFACAAYSLSYYFQSGLCL